MQPAIARTIRLVALLVAPLAAGGCISNYSVQSEEAFSAPPETARVCAYSWGKAKVLYGSHDVLSAGWKPPTSDTILGIVPHIEQLTMKCPPSGNKPAAQATVYLMELVNTATVAAAPAISLGTGLTLGGMPFTVGRNYAACVEATSPEGLHRFASAEGTITFVGNMWGSWGRGPTPTEHVQAQWAEREAKLLEQLSNQAWHKLWLLQAENLRVENCRRALERRL